MKKMTKILVALQLHEDLLSVLVEASAIARDFEAEITLVHAIPEAWEQSQDFDVAKHRAAEQCSDVRRRLVQAGTKVSPDSIVEFAVPADLILASADALDADLVVLGAGEKSTLDRLLVGSTAERVIRKATVPVWLVRPGVPRENLQAVACAVDCSKPAGEALATATSLARSYGARLHVLSVITDPDDQEEDRRMRELASQFDLHGVDVEFHVVFGTPSKEITRFAEENTVDVLVIGSAGRTGLERILDENTAERILRRIPCTLVAVPARAPTSAAP